MPTASQQTVTLMKAAADADADTLYALQKEIAAVRADRDAKIVQVTELTAKLAALQAGQTPPVVVPPVVNKPQPQPPIVVGETLVDLATLKQTKGGSYKLKPGTHTINGNNLVLDGVTFDLNGALVVQSSKAGDAACFDVQWRSGVTIRNGRMQFGSNQQYGVLGGATKDSTFADLSCVDRSGTLVQIAGDVLNPKSVKSERITLAGVFDGISDQYICYLDNIVGLKLALTIAKGSTNQCGFRVNGIAGMTGSLTVDGRAGLALYAKLMKEAADAKKKPPYAKSPTACRFHAGSNWDIASLITYGIDGWGPMGGDDGGKNNTTATRATELGLRLSGVIVRNYQHVGPISLNPGLVDADFLSGRIDGQFFGLTSQYPEAKDVKQGDIIRTTPEAEFGAVTFPGASLGFDRAAYPKIRFLKSTLNGKAIAA